MHCAHCGHKLEDAWTACPLCGARVSGGHDARSVAMGEVSEAELVRDALGTEYEILGELGRGGMATVYRAREKALDREVAVKVLPFSLAFDAEFVERFQREARTAAQLEHPNIIPIYRVGRIGQVIFFVMKYLRGGSLSSVLKDGGRMTPAEVRRVLVESGRALDYAAGKGIVHRDIKPDNIMFDEHGACVITDFGIAKAASGQRLTGTGMSIGTPHYMSPEQARAQETDGRSDIYSLGVVAYQGLVGAVPYDGEDSFSIGYKHIMESIPEPVLSTADERRLWLIIKRMLAKDPADRFQTGEDLVEEIEGRPAAPKRISGATRERLAALPTTPIPAVDAGPDGPRRPAMQRASALRGREAKGSFSWVVALLLLAVAGLFGAGKMGYGPLGGKLGGEAGKRGSEPPVDSAALASKPDSLKADSLRTTPDTTKHDSGGAKPDTTKSDSTGSNPPRLPASPPAAAPQAGATDSGALRILGLPAGSSVMVDDKAPTQTPIPLPAGMHTVAISAPMYVFYADTLDIKGGEELVFTPQLTRLGEPMRPRQRILQRLGLGGQPVSTCDKPGPGYNRDKSCWDVRPVPVAPPRVPVPADMTTLPGPVTLAAKVLVDGSTGEVAMLRPSEDSRFNDLASAYAMQMKWTPAQKSGQPVVGWTQVRLEPVRP
jgi:serine/threonine protein kinase